MKHDPNQPGERKRGRERKREREVEREGGVSQREDHDTNNKRRDTWDDLRPANALNLCSSEDIRLKNVFFFFCLSSLSFSFSFSLSFSFTLSFSFSFFSFSFSFFSSFFLSFRSFSIRFLSDLGLLDVPGPGESEGLADFPCEAFGLLTDM
jgi:hypothetical protein